MSEFTVVIPARYSSTRLPGKPLVDLLGKSMIQRVYEQAKKSRASRVVVATDDSRIEEAVTAFGGEVCLTREDHVSGTDRIAEVVDALELADHDCVINVQGDEPLMPPTVIDQLAVLLQQSTTVQMATLCEPVDTLEDLLDPNIVKVVKNFSNSALYFSRAPIPFARDHLPEKYMGGALRHIGIYGYRADLLRRFVTWQEGQLEATEKLEQLRVLENGVQILIEEAVEKIPPGIDTANDLERTLAVLRTLT